MATLFQSACAASGDWDQEISDAGCDVTFDTPTTGRMRASVDASTADSAWVRKLAGSSATNFTLAIKGLKLVQHGGAAGASAAIVAQLQNGFTTLIEVQIDSAGDVYCRNIAGSPIHSATINGTASPVDDGAEHNLLIQAQVNSYFRYYLDGVLVHNSTGLSGGAAVDLERIAAGIIAAPSAWSGTDLVVEFDDITFTDQPADDPYGDLSVGVEYAITLPHEAQGVHGAALSAEGSLTLPDEREAVHTLAVVGGTAGNPRTSVSAFDPAADARSSADAFSDPSTDARQSTGAFA